MMITLLELCVLLFLTIAAVEFIHWFYTRSPGEEPEDEHDGEAMKEACRYDFRKFCEYYLADTFHDTFTPSQAKTIAGLQTVILFGGHGVESIRRGCGATSMIMAAAIWAAAYRHRAFIVVLTGQASAAATMRHQVESELWHNERLWEDFPQGDPWPAIEFLSITESLRGVMETSEEGRRIRPDCILADSIGGWSSSPAEIDFRRRAFERFVGDLHYRQPGGRPLAIAELEGIEGEPRSTLAGLTAAQLRAKYARPADPQNGPPAAPKDPEIRKQL